MSKLKACLGYVASYAEDQVRVDFDLDSAIVTRADAEHNFKLDNEQTVGAWLKALSPHSMPRF